MEASTVKAPYTFMPGGYYWRVQTQDTTNVWGAYSEVRYYEYVLMQSPIHNGHSYGAFPIFTWNAYPHARRYQLEILIRRFDRLHPVSVCTYTYQVLSSRPCGLPNGLPYGDYYWRVNIDLGSGFITSPIHWALSVNIRNMPTPKPMSPVGIVLLKLPSDILFQWSPAAGATQYDVQASTDPAFRNLYLVSSTHGEIQTEMGMFTTPGRYYWRVRGWFDGKPGLWTTATFEVQ
jgi:hypothetical protein